MKFSGLQKTSLVDYPDKMASVLFTPGCNLRCPFCHNWRIVVDPKPPFLHEEAALRVLEDRKKYVDAVVVTGGEPTIHKEVARFVKKLKERGFAVKLDTNGFNWQVLEECLPHLDYVALDIKTTPAKYSLLGAKDTAGLLRTIELLKTGKVDYEFRTTVVPGLVNADDIPEMCKLIGGARTLALQQFVPGDTMDEGLRALKPYPPETIAGFAQTMGKCVENTILRV